MMCQVSASIVGMFALLLNYQHLGEPQQCGLPQVSTASTWISRATRRGTICVQCVEKRGNKVLDVIDGNWIVESQQYDGLELVYDKVAPRIESCLIDKGAVEIRIKGLPSITLQGKLVIDRNDGDSNEFKLTLGKEPQEKIYTGIYALDRKVLLVAIQSDASKKPPSRFNSTDGVSVYVLRRKK